MVDSINGVSNPLSEALDVNGEDLVDDQTTIYDSSAGALQSSVLDSNSVTVAGNTVSLGGSTSVDLSDLATAPHSALDDAPASAHHTRFTDAGSDSLGDIPSAPHSELDDAPTDAHHNQVEDESGTFTGGSSSQGTETVAFSQPYAAGHGSAGFDAALSPVSDADATVKSYTTNGSGEIDGMEIRWHNTTGANETVQWRFSGRPA